MQHVGCESAGVLWVVNLLRTTVGENQYNMLMVIIGYFQPCNLDITGFVSNIRIIIHCSSGLCSGHGCVPAVSADLAVPKSLILSQMTVVEIEPIMLCDLHSR